MDGVEIKDGIVMALEKILLLWDNMGRPMLLPVQNLLIPGVISLLWV